MSNTGKAPREPHSTSEGYSKDEHSHKDEREDDEVEAETERMFETAEELPEESSD